MEHRTSWRPGRRALAPAAANLVLGLAASVCLLTLAGAPAHPREAAAIESNRVAPGYVPHARPTFVPVGSDKRVVRPGDSGGPIFVGSQAWGTAIAYSRPGSSHHGYYMPVDHLGPPGARQALR